MAVTKQATLRTHERRLMESESRWLQQALFALSKAEDDRDKLDEAVSDTLPPLKVRIEGESFDIAAVRMAMSEAVYERSENLRSVLKQRSAVMR